MTKDEQALYIARVIETLEESRKKLQEPKNNRFYGYERVTDEAVNTVKRFIRSSTGGYSADWVFDAFAQHCASNAGRNVKYNYDIRTTNCEFIAIMKQRGSSETQAIKLLMRLQGNSAMTSGHLKELQETYKDYKRIGFDKEFEKWHLLDKMYNSIPSFLCFTIENLQGEELASEKAVDAFISLWDELITLMKKYKTAVIKDEEDARAIFGDVLDWLEKDSNNPLDYFEFSQIETASDFNYHYMQDKCRYFCEYLNMLSMHMERDGLFE